MKSKDRISKVLKSSIFSAILGATMGLLISELVKFPIDKIESNPTYMTIFFVGITIFFGVLITVLVLKIMIKIESVEEYRHEVIKSMQHGFIPIEETIISSFATSLVTKSSIVRTLGTARQDVLEVSYEKGARAYLKAFETRTSGRAREDGKFTYLRILPKKPNHKMMIHLNQCKENANRSGNEFDFKVIDESKACISYTIFDDTDLLLILDNEKHSGSSDNVLCLWTRDKKVISPFIKHFDDAWKKI